MFYSCVSPHISKLSNYSQICKSWREVDVLVSSYISAGRPWTSRTCRNAWLELCLWKEVEEVCRYHKCSMFDPGSKKFFVVWWMILRWMWWCGSQVNELSWVSFNAIRHWHSALKSNNSPCNGSSLSSLTSVKIDTLEPSYSEHSGNSWLVRLSLHYTIWRSQHQHQQYKYHQSWKSTVSEMRTLRNASKVTETSNQISSFG